MSRTADVNVRSERNPSARDPEKRSRPFTAVLLVGMFVVPAFGIFLRLIAFFAPEMLWLIGLLDLLLFGLGLGGFVIAHGLKVAKRDPFVVGHVFVTVECFAIATYITATVGWPTTDVVWYLRLLAVVKLPAWWVILHIFGALVLALSWLIPRTDAYRSAADPDRVDRSKLADLLKWPTAATIRSGSIVADEHSVTATIDHPGVPVKQLQNSLEPLVEYSGAIRGRSSIVPGDRGGVSEIRLVKSDPLDVWRPWPGLSHPGGSFAHPFRTAYYTTGEMQWYSFAKTPRSEILEPSPVAPDHEAPNDAHFGRQGATRSGKSGDNAVELAEAFSRRDCIPILVNTAKLTQDVGWCLDFAGLAADTKPKARALFDRIRALGELRSDVMGDPRLNGRHRTWSPRTYEELGFAAILLEVDEGDQVLSSADATWLATKGLSLGIFVSVMISRAATDGMASTLRSAITQWKCFGAGQAYDSGFVLSDETIAAGADPGALSTRFPGAQYLDKAQGVPEEKYPALGRSFLTADDFGDLRRAVEGARATFTPATFTAGELRVLGEVAETCAPKTILFGAYQTADRNLDPTAPAPAAASTAQEGPDMQDTLTLGDRPDDTGDPEVDELLSKPRPNFADLERQYGALPPPNEDLPDLSRPDLPAVALEPDRPALSPELTAAEFDQALIRLSQRNVTEFGNRDVMDEMRCDPNPTWVSRRFSGLCDSGKFVSPPGITIERVPGKAGRYLLTRMMPTGADPHGK